MAADESEPTAHSPQPYTDLSRRRMLQVAGATGATAAGLSGQLPDRLDLAQDGEAAVATGTAIAAIGVASGVSLLAGMAMTSGPAIEEQQDAEAQELHDRVYADALSMQEAQGPALDSMFNSATMIESQVRSNVSQTIAERTKLEDTQSEVETAAQDEVDRSVAELETRLFNYWTAQHLKLIRLVKLVDGQANLPHEDPFQIKSAEEGFKTLSWFNTMNDSIEQSDLNVPDGLASHSEEGQSVSLVDGDSLQVTIRWQVFDDWGWIMLPWAEKDRVDSAQDHSGIINTPLQSIRDGNSTANNPIAYSLGAQPRSGADASGVVEPLDVRRFQEIHEMLLEVQTTLSDGIVGMVDKLYQPIKDGEIDATELASGSALQSVAQDASTYNEAAASFRSYRFPEAESSCVIEAENGVRFEGILFRPIPDGDLPVGESIAIDDFLGEIHMAAEVRSIPDDVELGGGNTTDGNTTDGNTTDGNTTDGIDLSDGGGLEVGEVRTFQITEPFTIVALPDGQEGPLAFEEKELVEADDDAQAMIDALKEAREDEEESREERKEIVIQDNNGPGISIPDAPDNVPGGWLGGVAIIGGAVTGVSAFVSKVLP